MVVDLGWLAIPMVKERERKMARKRESHGCRRQRHTRVTAISTLVSSLLRYSPFRFASLPRLYRNRDILIKNRHPENMFLVDHEI